MLTYDEYKEIVENHIFDFIPSIDLKSGTLYDAMKYSLQEGGKRLRPVLLLAACDMVGGSINEALPYACALEYIHTYSLIHDDLPAMDNDDLRRGRPTNHKVFGDGKAILAGDGLLSAAFEAMEKDLMLFYDNLDQTRKRINAAYQIIKGAGVRGMVAGQMSDLEAENAPVSNELLEYIHINKTGALITSAIMAGLYLGEADSETLLKMEKYSECLGLAYQIKDDILDVVGDETKIGKKTGSDEKKHKNTYVSINGLEAANKKLEELTSEAVKSLNDSYGNIEFFRDIISDLACREK